METLKDLKGQLLISMPGLSDGPFAQTLIYVCMHDAKGAMGLIVNKPVKSISLADVFRQLEITEKADALDNNTVQMGGPVESQRGFILHSHDCHFDGTLRFENLSMSSSIEALKEIAGGKRPKKYFVALGYAGWSAEQLDREIQNNMWLSMPFDEGLVFSDKHEDKWIQAMALMGFSPHTLSSVAGHA